MPERPSEGQIFIERFTITGRLLILSSMVAGGLAFWAATEWMVVNLESYSMKVAALVGVVGGAAWYGAGRLVMKGLGAPFFTAKVEQINEAARAAHFYDSPIEVVEPEGARRAVQQAAAIFSNQPKATLAEIADQLEARGLSRLEADVLAHLVPAAFCAELLARHSVRLDDEYVLVVREGEAVTGSLSDQHFYTAAQQWALQLRQSGATDREIGVVARRCPVWQAIDQQLDAGAIPSELDVPRLVVNTR